MEASDAGGGAAPQSPFPRPESASFHTAMAHLYRGEMHRMTAWRQRLDVTTNWAILMTGAMTTFALGSREVPHFVLLLGFAVIAVSLAIESRRYQRLHHSLWRLHLLEACYFAPMLAGVSRCDFATWGGVLAQDLREPRMFLTWFSATKVRLRRNYLLLVYFITAVWITKLFIHPHDAVDLLEFWDRLAVGGILPSVVVAASATVFLVTCTVLAALAGNAELLDARASITGLRPDLTLGDS